MSGGTKLRLQVVLRITASYVLALPALLLLGEGVGPLMLFGYVSLPLIAIAGAVGYAFTPSVVSRPRAWATAALLLSVSFGYYALGAVGLMASALAAVPAAALFLLSLRAWPLAAKGGSRPI